MKITTIRETLKEKSESEVIGSKIKLDHSVEHNQRARPEVGSAMDFTSEASNYSVEEEDRRNRRGPEEKKEESVVDIARRVESGEGDDGSERR